MTLHETDEAIDRINRDLALMQRTIQAHHEEFNALLTMLKVPRELVGPASAPIEKTPYDKLTDQVIRRSLGDFAQEVLNDPLAQRWKLGRHEGPRYKGEVTRASWGRHQRCPATHWRTGTALQCLRVAGHAPEYSCLYPVTETTPSGDS